MIRFLDANNMKVLTKSDQEIFKVFMAGLEQVNENKNYQEKKTIIV